MAARLAVTALSAAALSPACSELRPKTNPFAHVRIRVRVTPSRGVCVGNGREDTLTLPLTVPAENWSESVCRVNGGARIVTYYYNIMCLRDTGQGTNKAQCRNCYASPPWLNHRPPGHIARHGDGFEERTRGSSRITSGDQKHVIIRFLFQKTN